MLLLTLSISFFFIAFYLDDYCRKRANNLSSPSDINKIKRLCEAASCLYIIAIILLLWNESNRKFHIFSWLLILPFLIYMFYYLWIAAKLRYIINKHAYDLIGQFYIQEYLSEIKKDISKAEAAIVKACAFNPKNPNVWIVRAEFSDIYKRDVNNASRFLQQANTIIKNMSNPTKEVLALYEYCYGNLLMGQEKWHESLVHLKKSQELIFTQGKEDIIKKLENQIEKEN